jgi:hypothetical protein
VAAFLLRNSGDLRLNEIDELITAMLVVTFAAVMLVAGELYIKRRPVQIAGPWPMVYRDATMAFGP